MPVEPGTKVGGKMRIELTHWAATCTSVAFGVVEGALWSTFSVTSICMLRNRRHVLVNLTSIRLSNFSIWLWDSNITGDAHKVEWLNKCFPAVKWSFSNGTSFPSNSGTSISSLETQQIDIQYVMLLIENMPYITQQLVFSGFRGWNQFRGVKKKTY